MSRIDGWRWRLEAALADNGRTMRDVSLRAGLSPGYVFSIIKGKDPTVERLVAILDEIGADLPDVLFGKSGGRGTTE